MTDNEAYWPHTSTRGMFIPTTVQLEALARYLASHREDIEHGINDFDELRVLLPWLETVQLTA